jgi:hypothetical protein
MVLCFLFSFGHTRSPRLPILSEPRLFMPRAIGTETMSISGQREYSLAEVVFGWLRWQRSYVYVVESFVNAISLLFEAIIIIVKSLVNYT